MALDGLKNSRWPARRSSLVSMPSTARRTAGKDTKACTTCAAQTLLADLLRTARGLMIIDPGRY